MAAGRSWSLVDRTAVGIKIAITARINNNRVTIFSLCCFLVSSLISQISCPLISLSLVLYEDKEI